MLVLITYDVSTTDNAGKTRLRKVAKACVDYGQRVQNSVFECSLDNAQFVALKSKLEKIADGKFDSLRYYCLGNNWRDKVEHFGVKNAYDPEACQIL